MEDDRRSADSVSAAELRQQIQQLQERLAFYEGFDALIQDNVTHARELFRLAAQERASASSDASRRNVGHRDDHLARRADVDLPRPLSAREFGRCTFAASQRRARRRDCIPTMRLELRPAWSPGRAAIVVHGVPSARSALSLQRFVHALPEVSDVSAREFAGGVLRLDAELLQPLKASQFDDWDRDRSVQVLTHRADVFEFSVEEIAPAAQLSS